MRFSLGSELPKVKPFLTYRLQILLGILPDQEAHVLCNYLYTITVEHNLTRILKPLSDLWSVDLKRNPYADLLRLKK